MKLKLLLTTFILIIILSCENQSALDEYYHQEGNFSGSIYDALNNTGKFTNFINGIDSAELANQLKNTLVTVIAPSDEAFNTFFNENPDYNSLSGMPISGLQDLISHHVITWPHSPSSFEDDFSLFRRQTNMATRYRTKFIPEYGDVIVQQAPKYLNFYFPEMLATYNATNDDYTKFTGQEISEATGFNIYDAQVDSIVPYGNGWVYYVNKVVAPVENLDDWLLESEDYSLFEELYNSFSIRVDHDGVPSTPHMKRSHLYLNDRTYGPDAELDFETASQTNVTLKAGSGFTVVAPQNDALQGFIDEYLGDYPDFESKIDLANFSLATVENVHVHNIVRNILAPYFMISNTVYPSTFSSETGINGKDGTKLSFSDDEVVDYKLCSNGLGYGINKFIVPRSFRTILKPATTTPDYMYFLTSVMKSKIVTYLNSLETEYTLLLPTDSAFVDDGFSLIPIQDYTGDAKLTNDRDEVVFLNPKYTTAEGNAVSIEIMFDIIFTHLFIGDITPGAQVQYIKNAKGDYVGVTSDSIWSGGNLETRWPSGNDTTEKVSIEKSIEDLENGKIYVVDKLVKAPSMSLGQMLTTNPEYDRFSALCKSAGVLEDGELTIAVNYPTLFVPTNAMVDSFQLDGKWPTDQAEQEAIIRYCFVDQAVFTTQDINESILTLCKDEDLSTQFNSVYKTAELNGTSGNLTIKGDNNTEAFNIIEGRESNTICTNGIIHLVDGFVN